ncbi:hypothetical protein BC831DRAFT_458664, partial [Entophlyctis helioformis]
MDRIPTRDCEQAIRSLEKRLAGLPQWASLRSLAASQVRSAVKAGTALDMQAIAVTVRRLATDAGLIPDMSAHMDRLPPSLIEYLVRLPVFHLHKHRLGNIVLDRKLRALVWRSCLHGPYEPLPPTFQSVSADHGDAIYDMCAGYMDGRPVLADMASQYTFMRRLERVVTFLVARNQPASDMDSPSLFNVQRHWIPTSIAVLHVCDDDSDDTNVLGGMTQRYLDLMLCKDDESMAERVMVDMDHHVYQHDAELYDHIHAAMRSVPGTHTTLWSAILGDLFIGHVGLDTAAHIHTLLMAGSMEGTGDPSRPTIETLCGWAGTCLALSVRQSLKNAKGAGEMLDALHSQLPRVTPSMLAQSLDATFFSRVRQPAPSPLTAWAVNGTGSEDDLVAWEEQQRQRQLAPWQARRDRRIQHRRRLLIRRWQRVTRHLMTWISFIDAVRSIQSARPRSLHQPATLPTALETTSPTLHAAPQDSNGRGSGSSAGSGSGSSSATPLAQAIHRQGKPGSILASVIDSIHCLLKPDSRDTQHARQDTQRFMGLFGQAQERVLGHRLQGDSVAAFASLPPAQRKKIGSLLDSLLAADAA